MSVLKTKVDAKIGADNTFKRLADLWKEGLDDTSKTDWLKWDFWKAGNTLDAYVDYLVASGNTDEHGFIERSYKEVYWPKRDYNTSGKWRDDYGWWGNAFVNVAKNFDHLGISNNDTTRDDYISAAKNCWTCLRDNADKNWNYGMRYPDVPVNIGAGWCAWNNDGAEKYWNSKNPSTDFQPTPNTVTNLGFLSLSFGLKNLVSINDPDYKEYNVAALNGITKWFFTLSKESHKSGKNMLFNDVLLVRETPNPWAHQKWCFDLARGWSADQGVFIHVLLEGINSGDSATIDYSKKMLLTLLEGYQTVSENSTKNTLIADSEFREFKTKPLTPGLDSNLSNFNDNYCTGPGVFMRYVSNAINKLNFDNKHKDVVELIKQSIVISSIRALENQNEKDHQVLYWYGDIKDSPYYTFYKDAVGKQKYIWPFAFQVAALDLFVALMKVTKAESS